MTLSVNHLAVECIVVLDYIHYMYVSGHKGTNRGVLSHVIDQT